MPLNFQLLRELGQHLVPGLRYRDHVLDPDASEPRVIKTRFYRDQLTGLKPDLLKPRILVNFKTEAVTCSVKETDPSALTHLGWEPAFHEQILNPFVNRSAVSPGLNLAKSQCLSGFNSVPQSPLGFAGPSADDGSSQIAEVSGFRISREHIENDQRIGLKRA